MTRVYLRFCDDIIKEQAEECLFPGDGWIDLSKVNELYHLSSCPRFSLWLE